MKMPSMWMRGAACVAVGAFLLVACAPARPAPTIISGPTGVAKAPTQPAPEPLVCNTSYEKHELTAPYRQDKQNPARRYTLAPEEFAGALSKLGIASACVPQGVDAPHVEFDSRELPATAATGQMISLGFDGWRQGRLVYATYNLSLPTEYDTFAKASDYDAVRNSSQKGFERAMAGLCYGTCTVYKTFVYPFEDHYVAVVLDLGAYEYGTAVDAQVSKFTAGEYPAEMQADLASFDTLVRGLQFAQP